MPKSTTELPIPVKPKHEPPHIFGCGLRDRLLITLAINKRPLYVAELVKILNSDDRKIRNTLAVLRSCGVVVRDTKSRSGRFAALNRGFPAHKEMLVFLRQLQRRHPQPIVGKPTRCAERLVLKNLSLKWNAANRTSKSFDLLFYSKVRTRVLLAISASSSTDVTDITNTFTEDKRSVWNAVNHWQREGVIRSVIVGRRRALELDPTFYAAKEMKALLRALRRIAVEYDRLAEFSVRKPGSPRFVAER